MASTKSDTSYQDHPRPMMSKDWPASQPNQCAISNPKYVKWESCCEQ